MLKLVASLSILGMFFSCGKKSDDDAEVGGIAELQGTWVQSCVVSGTTSYKTTYVFSGASLTGTTQNYSDATCTTKSFAGSWSGSYTGGTDATTPSGAKKQDFTYATLTYVANTAALATQLNSLSYCEYTDWAVDVAKNGIGKKCGINAATATTTSVGTQVFTIYKVSGTTLSLGAADTTYTGKTDALRTQTYETATYTKQ